MIEFKDKNVIISTHVYATGPSQDLKEFLINHKVGKLLYIWHPLFYDKKLKSSGYEYFENWNLLKESYKKIKKLPSLLAYLKDYLLNIYYVFKYKANWDIYVGSDNLNASSWIFLKKLWLVKKVIYYVIDYNPNRFKNKLLNKIFHKIDQYCVKYADETWNLSPRMTEGRKQYFNFEWWNQKVVPIWIWYDRIKRVNFQNIEKNTLVFMWHIIEKQWVQYVIDAIPLIIEKIPNFKFLVIWGWEYLQILKQKVIDLKIEHYVQFTGYVKDHKDIEDMLVKCAGAVALYEKYDSDWNISFTYYADPGKLKSYLASWLPILLTDVSYNAKDIEHSGCWWIIDYSKESISKSVVELLSEENKLEMYRENCINYAKKYDWNNIFITNLNF